MFPLGLSQQGLFSKSILSPKRTDTNGLEVVCGNFAVLCEPPQIGGKYKVKSPNIDSSILTLICITHRYINIIFLYTAWHTAC